MLMIVIFLEMMYLFFAILTGGDAWLTLREVRLMLFAYCGGGLCDVSIICSLVVMRRWNVLAVAFAPALVPLLIMDEVCRECDHPGRLRRRRRTSSCTRGLAGGPAARRGVERSDYIAVGRGAGLVSGGRSAHHHGDAMMQAWESKASEPCLTVVCSMRDGLPVPARVLADYPDLFPRQSVASDKAAPVVPIQAALL